VKRFVLPCCAAVFMAFFSSCDFPSAEKASKEVTPWKRPKNLFVLTPDHAAFVVIDMQKFACAPTAGGALPRITEVIATINRLADFCRKKGIPVIWVRHNITSAGTHDDAGLYSRFHDRRHMEDAMNLGRGTAVYSKMHLDPSRDYVVFKNRCSAFLSNPPELREQLDSLKRRQLIVAGIAANVCVESTIRDAMQLDYEVVLVSDGITATDDALLESTLANTRLFFGDVRTAEEIMEGE
jgi:ureidoacrylate peracid hydrolase